MTRVNNLDNNITALNHPPQLAPELQVFLVRSHHSPSLLLEESQLPSPVKKVLVFLLKIAIEFLFPMRSKKYLFELLWGEALPAGPAWNSQLHLFGCWASLFFSSCVNIHLKTFYQILVILNLEKVDLSGLCIQQFDIPFFCIELPSSHFSSVHKVWARYGSRIGFSFTCIGVLLCHGLKIKSTPVIPILHKAICE